MKLHSTSNKFCPKTKFFIYGQNKQVKISTRTGNIICSKLIYISKNFCCQINSNISHQEFKIHFKNEKMLTLKSSHAVKQEIEVNCAGRVNKLIFNQKIHFLSKNYCRCLQICKNLVITHEHLWLMNELRKESNYQIINMLLCTNT